MWNVEKVNLYSNTELAMDKATETGSALQIFKDRVTAVKFAADKKKDCDKKCSTVASSNKKQTKNADESKKEEVSEVSAVTPDKKITINWKRKLL